MIDSDRWNIQSRTTAWREAFLRYSHGGNLHLEESEELPALRILTRHKIAEYRRRKAWRRALLRASALAGAVALVAFAMLLRWMLT